MCGGHGEEGGDPQCDPGRHRLVVDPEGEPGDEDDHGGRHVDGQDEEGQLSLWRDIAKLSLEICLIEIRKGRYLAKTRSTCKQLYSPAISLEATFEVTVAFLVPCSLSFAMTITR